MSQFMQSRENLEDQDELMKKMLGVSGADDDQH